MDGFATWSVYRRYSEFHKLYKKLAHLQSDFPCKHLTRCEGVVLEERRAKLEVWLQEVVCRCWGPFVEGKFLWPLRDFLDCDQHQTSTNLQSETTALADRVIVKGGEMYASQVMGLYEMTSTPPGPDNDGRPIYKNDEGLFLFYSGSTGRWIAGPNLSQEAGLMVSAGFENTQCVTRATGWHVWFAGGVVKPAICIQADPWGRPKLWDHLNKMGHGRSVEDSAQSPIEPEIISAYLPKSLGGVPVLLEGMLVDGCTEEQRGTWLATNTYLHADTPGIAHRATKDLDDKMRVTLPWGAAVEGVDEGSWVRCRISKEASH